MTIIRTTGNAKPHIVHHGYQNQSRHSSRWADVTRRGRAGGEIHPFIGALLLIALFAVLPFAVAVFS